MTEPPPQRVAVVTGTRAEYGLLTPVMRAIEAHPSLTLLTTVTGTHLLGPSFTKREVGATFRVDAEIPMQREGETGRLADAGALGRGIEGLAGAIERLRPDWVVVLGDRIEALAGAAAASVGGVPVAHIHGGDRAEGIADESIRHAITKLAHVHFPATPLSAQRIERMGEDPWRIRTVGSPAIDGLNDAPPLDDAAYASLGAPRVLFLMHPDRADAEFERVRAITLIDGLATAFEGRVLCLHPNFDAGRAGILAGIEHADHRDRITVRDHLPRAAFIGLLRRLASEAGIMVGNSSAGLIEAAALKLPAVDVGPRQAGRERPDNVVHVDDPADLPEAVERALKIDRQAIEHPYGDGRSGSRIASALGQGWDRERLLRKRCVY